MARTDCCQSMLDWQHAVVRDRFRWGLAAVVCRICVAVGKHRVSPRRGQQQVGGLFGAERLETFKAVYGVFTWGGSVQEFPSYPRSAAEPAPGLNGGISLHSAPLSVQQTARLPRIKCGAGCGRRGNDGILTKHMANVNRPWSGGRWRSYGCTFFVSVVPIVLCAFSAGTASRTARQTA